MQFYFVFIFSLCNMMKSCIAVLTRGYSDITQYSMLIKRNKHIANNLHDKSIHNLIFHEGNITEDQQIYIQNETPDLQIKFINILNVAFNKKKENIPIEEMPQFGLGYRHMCSFWIVDFLNIVKEYDSLLRIDEDCYINFNIDKLLLNIGDFTFVVGEISGDAEEAVVGINDFSIDFINKNKDNFTFKNFNTKSADGPYTNIIGFSLNKIRENELFRKYINELDSSEMIYKRRWGDLPLWGEVIYYIFGSESMKIDRSISYFHGSHDRQIN